MTKILLATVYGFESIIAASTKISAERLILLIDKEPDATQKKSLDLIKQSLGSVLEIKTVKTDVYDVVEVAKETVKIIDLLSDKDEIFIDITAGRKPKMLGLLFGAYARSRRVKRIMYVTEEKKRIINLPKLSYNITPGQQSILEELSKGSTSIAHLAERVDISKAMLYKHIKELKDLDIIEDTNEGVKLTDYGRVAVL